MNNRCVGADPAGLLTHLLAALRSLSEVMVLGDPMRRVPNLGLTVSNVKADQVEQRLADSGIRAVTSDPSPPVLEALGVAEIGGAVHLGLAHRTTAAEVDQVVRSVASLG